MIHITENLNRILKRNICNVIELVPLKMTTCPFCSQPIGYYTVPVAACHHCFMPLPDFKNLFDSEGLDNINSRIAFHKGEKL